jgi:(4S)-4-hydroxy-5-phosphonooxypentane-2,3-dione isomerase
MKALVVSLNVKPDMREQFLAAAQDDSTCSVRDEPGCLRFDVLQDVNDENRYYFYEVYRDDAAFAAHATMPHFARWRQAAAECLNGDVQRTDATTLFPSDYR